MKQKSATKTPSAKAEQERRQIDSKWAQKRVLSNDYHGVLPRAAAAFNVNGNELHNAFKHDKGKLVRAFDHHRRSKAGARAAAANCLPPAVLGAGAGSLGALAMETSPELGLLLMSLGTAFGVPYALIGIAAKYGANKEQKAIKEQIQSQISAHKQLPAPKTA
jgi:hypothetical protein